MTFVQTALARTTFVRMTFVRGDAKPTTTFVGQDNCLNSRLGKVRLVCDVEQMSEQM